MNADAAPNTSLLGRWDPRLKICGLLILAFTFSFLSQIHALPVMAVVTLAFVCMSGMPLGQLMRRLRYPSLLVLGLVILLPFVSGTTPLLHLGGLTVTTEGSLAALVIGVRFLCIVTLASVLLGSTPLLENIKALQALGLPYIMADMALLMVRYLDVFSKDLSQMRIAMRLRGHNDRAFSRTTLLRTAWLMGCLLLRSHDRSERVYMAMRLRGYGAKAPSPGEFRVAATDVAGLTGVCALAIALVLLDVAL